MDILAIAHFGMQTGLQRAEIISQNVANSLTPGYKRQISIVTTFTSAMRKAQDSGLATLSAPVRTIDASTGAARYSGIAQDVMVQGNSFIEVSTSDGVAYTKQGNLRVDVQGRLVTGNGAPVIGAGGEIILTGEPFTVSASGDIQQGGRVAGRLKLVSFVDPALLLPLGSGLYTPGNATQDNKGHADSLRIGFLEGSNVISSQEMVRLTETVRHFESMQKIVQGYDESMEKAIRKLGEF